ncbi:hypothetical protein ABW20_dc0100262 [Dactylellina cionopaga]|nr:hypothetical protein ABW20_dc0100262 [Dactylellina cionopaga]
MFTLGIGNGVSHSLINGLARVGGGYSQILQRGEKLDSKVVRMLHAALGQHIDQYTLSFPDEGAPDEDSDEDYDMLEDIDIPVKKDIKTQASPVEMPKKISLFDTSVDPSAPLELPTVPLPPLLSLPAKLQSPSIIPPLFPFSRTNIYVVFSPAPKVLPKRAFLHVKTPDGDDLELEIPILAVEDGKDVLQLAARSFLQELEDGKGYFHEHLLESGLKEKQESLLDEIVEREGARWGEEYGVASKWTAFVAIENGIENPRGLYTSVFMGIWIGTTAASADDCKRLSLLSPEEDKMRGMARLSKWELH